ncbi:MAG: FtsQ-type POTRA domain-containing protein [Clostridiales bacterium]|nr:FtsQ-type POTRA domain-containing protein [Clostridiales bacterium]
MGKVVATNIKKRKRPRRKWPMVVGGILLIFVILLLTGFFDVEHPTIEGNERVTDEIVMENLDMHEDMNLIWYALTHYNTKFELDPLILSAEVFIKWPHNILVKIVEKKVMGYLPYMGMYLCIDTTGSVLDSVHEIDEDTPMLTGIQVQSFSLGEAIDTEDTERFTIMLDCLNVLEKYELLAMTDEISVARAEDVHWRIDGLDVSIGTTTDLDRKAAALKEILKDTNHGSGILHLEDLNNQIYIENTNS